MRQHSGRKKKKKKKKKTLELPALPKKITKIGRNKFIFSW